MIDATVTLPDGWEAMDIDALLAVDGTDAVYCERCGELVDIEDSGIDEATGETICIACFIAVEARHSVAAIDAAEADHASERDRALAAMPVPDTDGQPY